jgi:hypothetical protein
MLLLQIVLVIFPFSPEYSFIHSNDLNVSSFQIKITFLFLFSGLHPEFARQAA